MFAPALTWIQRLPARLSNLSRLLPCQCALCGELAPEPICAACDAQYLHDQHSRCPRCGIAMLHHAQPTECPACLRSPPAFDATIVATDYAAPVDQLVLALKFGRQLALASALSGALGRALARYEMLRPELLTAVPLGRQRLTERGFNQSLEIARPLSKMLGLPLAKQCVQRLRETTPQSLLAPAERHRNVRRAFFVPQHAVAEMEGRHVAVVDDVMTTGATLNELAITLKRSGASRVTNLVFARALPQ